MHDVVEFEADVALDELTAPEAARVVNGTETPATKEPDRPRLRLVQ